jgi:hypothetical protein
MDLKAISARAVTTAFRVVGTLKTAATLYSRAVGTYNATTGATTPVDTAYPVNAILTAFSDKETDGENVLTTDRRILIDTAEIPGLTIKINDYLIETVTSARWEIRGIELDPSLSMWRLHARNT